MCSSDLVIAVAVLTITTILLIYDAHLESKIRRHNAQLEEANEQLEEVNAQLHHVATHDALSGLPNRLLLADRLNQAIAQAERHQNRFAVFVVDLDRFKSINDSLGHLAGDAMLKEVARRLAMALRKGRSWQMRLARLGAAIVMGLAISGMHYTGMAASRFAPGSYCTGVASSNSNWLAITIAVIAVAVLTITTILLIYDAHLESKIRRHNAQLEEANEQLEEVNAQLQHVATHDALSGLPNR